MMVRKDSEKDADRPHYYSQFWLDVAAGRRIIGTPKTEDDGDIEEAGEPVIPATSDRSSAFSDDGYTSKIVHPAAEPVETEEQEYLEPEEDLEPESVAELDADTLVADEDIPDMDLELGEEEPEGEEEGDYYSEGEEGEEDDDLDWGRGRKKTKPVRPTKPVVKKAGKRDTRRTF